MCLPERLQIRWQFMKANAENRGNAKIASHEILKIVNPALHIPKNIHDLVTRLEKGPTLRSQREIPPSTLDELDTKAMTALESFLATVQPNSPHEYQRPCRHEKSVARRAPSASLSWGKTPSCPGGWAVSRCLASYGHCDGSPRILPMVSINNGDNESLWTVYNSLALVLALIGDISS
jgi:hypothetical protein